jgi:hypothetical protein
MSDSRYRNDDNDNDYDNVESYRGRRREEDRRSSRRDRSPDDYDADRKKASSSTSSSSANNTDNFQSERAQRMARLRKEMKEEDRELAALDNGKDQHTSIKQAPRPQEAIIEVKPEELEGLDEEEQMRKLLGFEGFGSTKGESVEDNQSSAARGVAGKHKARKYRQYMNRKSGFNRPLEEMG